MTQHTRLDRLHLADYVLPGDAVAWPQGPGEPLALTELLLAQRKDLGRPELIFGLTGSATLTPDLADDFALRALNGAGNSRRVTAQAEITIGHVSWMPRLIRSGAIRVDVALIQVRPLPGGQYSLGVICDFTQAMIESARTVIALVNPALPPMRGDAVVAADDIDLLVEGDARVLDLPDPQPSAIDLQVARHVAALIPDGATIQLGVGTLPVAVAAALHGHRDLGVHSGVVSDVLIELIERGVVNNSRKGRDQGKTVTGGLFGTQKLRDFAQAHDLIDMRCADYTHHLAVTSSLHRFQTINSAIEVDLTGQVNAEVAGGRYLGAVGGQVDFVRAGVASEGGRSFIALPSTTPDGRTSRIVASLDGRPVTTARSDVDTIVTEYGAAQLMGCSLQERCRRLVAIAHPDHRDALMRAWQTA